MMPVEPILGNIEIGEDALVLSTNSKERSR